EILQFGLSNRSNIQGICVVRSDDNRVLHFIAQQILKMDTSTTSNNYFCVFKIIPSNHNLTANDIDCDLTSEFTNPLHSYIKKKTLNVTREDICKYYIYMDENDENTIKNQFISEGIIVSIEYPDSRKWANYLLMKQLEDECQ
ncbi:MAG: hypothetical protein WCJ61_17345, partial [Paludibacter sp.]